MALPRNAPKRGWGNTCPRTGGDRYHQAGSPLEQKHKHSLSFQPGQRWRRRRRKYESAGSRKKRCPLT
eukprot:7470974-Alexandrium_andersonii.AAC.1